MNPLLIGYPVLIATQTHQNRSHRKKRINKKWRKRYGTTEINKMPNGQVILYDGKLWMTKKTLQDLKVLMEESEVLQDADSI